MGFASFVNMDRIPKKDTLEQQLWEMGNSSSGPLGTALYHIAMIEKEKKKLKELEIELKPLNAIQKRLNAIES